MGALPCHQNKQAFSAPCLLACQQGVAAAGEGLALAPSLEGQLDTSKAEPIINEALLFMSVVREAAFGPVLCSFTH